MASTNPARGMRDFLPADVRKRNYVIGIIKEVYESYGFEPLETPAVENIETLMGKYGDEGNQLIFKILKRGEKLGGGHELRRDPSLETKFKEALLESKITGATLESTIQRASKESLADLALRYDLTVPLARVVANNKNDLPKFFKRYQIQPVWRADRPARGRFREFYQCDVDAIGSSSMVVEAELISAVDEILSRLGFKDAKILVNHRDILKGLLDIASIVEEKQADALVALDKLDKIGPQGVAEELISRKVFDLDDANNFVDLVRKDVQFQMFPASDVPQNAEQTRTQEHDNDLFLINKFRNLLTSSPAGLRGTERIAELFDLLGLNLKNRLSFEPSLARGLSYYTGTIIEVGLDSGDFKGSIGGGGRYDGLIGMFGKEQIPACGFSLGLERILVVMDERGMFPPEIAASVPADVMVTIWSKETVGESLKLAAELRKGGLRVTVYPEADKLGKQIKYADSIKVPFVCVLGENELAEKKVTLKNMKTGEQQSISRSDIVETLGK